MTDSPSIGIGSRYGSAVAACFATLPRRLVVIGGFVLLGWLGLALASASHANADTRPAPDAVSSLLGTATDLVQRAPLVGTVTDTAAQLTAPEPVHQIVEPVATSLSTPDSDPVTALAAPLSDPASGLLPKLARSADELSRSTTGTSSLAPSTFLPVLLGGLAGTTPDPGSGTVAPITPPVAPLVDQPHAAPHAVTAAAATTSPSTSRAADVSLPAAPGSVSASRGPLAGPGVPAPLPTLPPAGPDTVLAAGSGSTATSSSGSGSSSAPGCTGNGLHQPDLRPLGIAESARTRPVRNSAAEPSVSPD